MAGTAEWTLIFDDGRRLELTRKRTAAVGERWWKNPGAIPPRVRKARDFQPCEICPKPDARGCCHALYPLLSVAELPRDISLRSAVTVRVREGGEDCPVRTIRTTMQAAMQSVALLCLTAYCEAGKSYHRLFRGTSLIMGLEAFAGEVARNLYHESNGEPEAVRRLAARFCEDLQATSHGHISRLGLVCRDHPLLDAIVNALIVLECLVDEKAGALISRAAAGVP